jgi:tRNA A37 methylthiotransferase MiaB
MFKILFYCAQEIEYASNRIFLSIAPLYLKTYIDNNLSEIANKLEWLPPQQRKLNDDDFVELCDRLKPDLICTSHYIWNHDFVTQQLSRVHNKIPATIIACGGPSINVNIDTQFFKKYPFFDYAVYGAGEEAFGDLIKSLVTKTKLIAFNTSNMAWYDNQKQKLNIANFKYVPQLKVSPYLHCADMLENMVKTVQDLGVNAAIPYELTRGCPYSCTFCDWNSGLSNKVTRRNNSYKDEIDLFYKCNIQTIFLSDANVGQYNEDIDMIEYFAKVNLEKNAGFTLLGNFSKLKKSNNLKIYHAMARGKLIQKNFNISVQDIHEEILKNVERPDVGWAEHEKMIDELITSYPQYVAMTQLILGLPGQTPKTWRETLRTVTAKKVFPQIFMNELLPASPAARSNEYQQKFNFKYSTSERLTFLTGSDGYYYKGNFPQSCVSFNDKDMVQMILLTIIYLSLSALKSITVKENKSINFEPVVDKFLSSDVYAILSNNLYTNWKEKDKFYFSLDFDKNERHVPACSFFDAVYVWCGNIDFFKFLLSCDLDTNMKKDIFVKFKSNKISDEVLQLLKEYA